MRPISLISTLFAVVVLVVSIPVDFDEALIPEQGGTLNPDQFYAFNAQQGDSSNIGPGSDWLAVNPPPSSNKIPLKKVPTKGSPLAVPAGGVPGQNIPPKQGQEVSPGPGQNTNPGQEQGPPPTSGSQETQGPGARPTPDANGIGPFPYEPNQPPPIDSQWDQFLDDCPYQAGDRCPCYAFCKTGYCDPKNPRQCETTCAPYCRKHCAAIHNDDSYLLVRLECDLDIYKTNHRSQVGTNNLFASIGPDSVPGNDQIDSLSNQPLLGSGSDQPLQVASIAGSDPGDSVLDGDNASLGDNSLLTENQFIVGRL